MEKYDEDLNTTLIFVRFVSDSGVHALTESHRLVCSLPSPPPSSSKSTPTSSKIRTT